MEEVGRHEDLGVGEGGGAVSLAGGGGAVLARASLERNAVLGGAERAAVFAGGDAEELAEEAGEEGVRVGAGEAQPERFECRRSGSKRK